MNPLQTTVYRSICELPFTPPGVDLSFEDRLARENGWDLLTAIEVIGEYRKFLFLMLECGHPVTPSDQVDQAWHLHLLYTDSYWNGLCKGIAKRPLHHGPTAGGDAERQKYDDWYARTKASYRKFFGHEPPASVWPSADIRFGEDIHFQRVNRARNWVVPNPIFHVRKWFGLLRRKERPAALPMPTSDHPDQRSVIEPLPHRRTRHADPMVQQSAIGIMLLQLFDGKPLESLNPYTFDGLMFLVFFVALATTGLLVAGILKMLLRNRQRLEKEELARVAQSLQPLDIGWLARGCSGALEVAVVDLINRDALTAKKGKLTAKRDAIADDSLIAKTVLSATGKPNGVTFQSLQLKCWSLGSRIQKQLGESGIAETFGSLLKSRIAVGLVMGFVLTVGLIRVVQGISNKQEIGILIVMMVIFSGLTALMLNDPRATRKGRQVLKYLRKRDKGIEKQSKQDRTDKTDLVSMEQAGLNTGDLETALMATALFGMGSCSADVLNFASSDVLPTGGGRGDGGGCSGGDGGGCGGGGCGGCGGCG